jgi:hypothetical protein
MICMLIWLRDGVSDQNLYLDRPTFGRKHGTFAGRDGLDLSAEKSKGERQMNWHNRGDRIGRMQERDQFARYFMPLAYLVAVAGLLVMAWQGINKMENGHWSRDVFVVGQLLVLMPVPFWLFRLCRGHYSSRLKD